MIISGLLFIVFGLPLILLSRRFYKLSDLEGLTGRARTVRLVWLVLLASGITVIFYLFVLVISSPPPTAHAVSRSAWPWGQEHPISAVLLAGLTAALLLVPTRRLAGLCFGAGVLLGLSGVGVWWYFTEHQANVLHQMEQAGLNYRDSGWQSLTADSLRLQVSRCHSTAEPGVTAPVFPGGDTALQQQLQTLRRHSTRHAPPGAYVHVEFIVETTGKIAFPHVRFGLGPGYDEEAVQVVRQLPPFTPAIGPDGQPVAVFWYILVPF